MKIHLHTTYKGLFNQLAAPFFFICFTIFTVINTPSFAASLLDGAKTALNAGKYASVISNVDGLLKSKSITQTDTAKALLLRGLAYQKLGRNALAIADFSNADWLDKLGKSDRVSLLTQRAASYKALGQVGMANKDLGLLSSLSGVGKSLPTSGNISSKATTALTKTASKAVSPVTVTNSPAISSSIEAAKNTTEKTSSSNGFGNLFGFFNGSTNETNTAATPTKAQEPPKKTASINTAPTPKLTPKASHWPAHKVELVPVDQKETAQNSSGGFWSNLFGLTPKKTTNTTKIATNDIATPKTALPKQVASLPKVDQKVSKKPIVTGSIKKTASNSIRTKSLKPVNKTKNVATNKSHRKSNSGRISSPQFLQLASFANKSSADKYAAKINNQHGALFQNKSAMVVRTIIGNSNRYRIYLGPFPNQHVGKTSCSQLKKHGLDCILVR